MDRDQETTPRPHEVTRVRLSDHDTVVARYGKAGPAVLLLHGLGMDWRMWQPAVPYVAEERRVFAYDVRGHGMAALAPAAGDMGRLADDMVGVMDALGLPDADVAGLSLGGEIALTAAVRTPERLRSLALLATTDFPFPAFGERAEFVEKEGPEALVGPLLGNWFTPGALAGNAWGVRYARERILGSYAADWAATWRALSTLDVQERLGGFDKPTLALAAEIDRSTTPEIMTGLANRMPNATFTVLPGIPHMMTLERPDAAGSALADFWAPAAPTPRTER